MDNLNNKTSIQPTWIAKGFSDSTSALAVSHDGSNIVVGTDSRGIHLSVINAGNGKISKSLGNYSWDVAFSPDGKLIVGSNRTTIGIWSFETGKLIKTIEIKHMSSIRVFTFTPDGKFIAVGGLETTVQLIDIETGMMIKEFDIDGGYCFALAFSPDGKMLAGGGNPDILLWDVTTGKPIRTLKTYAEGRRNYANQDTFTILFNNNGSSLFSAGADGIIRQWDPATGVLNKAYKKVECGFIFSIAVDPKSTLLAAPCGSDIMIIQIDTGETLGTLKGHNKLVESIVFSPD